MKHYYQKGRREFWIRETGTGQQVAQVHERLMMIMMMMSIIEQGSGQI